MRGSSARILHWRNGFTFSRRHLSSQKPMTQVNAKGSPQQTPDPQSAFARVIARTPKFLRPTIAALHNAPVTHITAFLLLHELTAIVPLLGLAGAFHYYRWLPPYFAEGAWVVAGVERFGRYFRRKGWIGEHEEREVEQKVKEGQNAAVIEERERRGVKWSDGGAGGVRWVVEFATAYAVVKALLPLRLIISVWGAPWFARWTVIPASKAMNRLFRRNKGTPVAGTKAELPKSR